MISMKFAKAGVDLCYTSSQEYSFGPFDLNGEDVFSDEISLRSSFDEKKERPGIFGENHVNHRQLHADVYQDPWFGTFPDEDVKIKLREKLSSGNWGSRYWSILRRDLSPAYAWTRTQSFRYIRKLSPRVFEEVAVTWNFRFTHYSVERAHYKRFVCKPLKQGSRSFDVDHIMHASNYMPAGYPTLTIQQYNSGEMKDLIPELLGSLRKETPSTTWQPAGFAYCPQVKLMGNNITPRDIMLRLQRYQEDRHLFPEDLKSHGELAGEAIDTLDTNSINMFEFLKDIRKPWELVPKLKNLSQLKTHAGNYLGMQYGILPTVSDLQTLYEAITKTARPYFDSNNYQVLTAGHSVSRSSNVSHVETTNRIKIAVNPSNGGLSTLSERLRDIGGFPSVDNLWELIPFSFVLDWFINVGNFLEGIDDRFRLAQLPIVYVTTSSKVIITPKKTEYLTEIGCHGDVSIVLYDRNVSTTAPSPPLSFEASNSLQSHWLEGGALLVVLRK